MSVAYEQLIQHLKDEEVHLQTSGEREMVLAGLRARSGSCRLHAYVGGKAGLCKTSPLGTRALWRSLSGRSCRPGNPSRSFKDQNPKDAECRPNLNIYRAVLSRRVK